MPVGNWFNFTADIKYRTLTVDEAEEEYNRREKTVNYFSVMVKKRLQDNKAEDEGEDKNGDNKSKLAGKTSSLVGKHYFFLEKKFKPIINSLSNHKNAMIDLS